MKNFLFTVPQQPAPSLKKTRYANPCNNPVLKCDEEISFPILALIKNTVESSEKICITAIRQEHRNCITNTETFISELESLKKTSGFEYELNIVNTPFSEKIDDHMSLFGQLIDHIKKDDVLYSDITFGTKPIPMIMLMTLTYAYRFTENASVENIVYGQYNHDTNVSSLYDVTALFYMNSTINTMSDSVDPKKFIKAVLDL